MNNDRQKREDISIADGEVWLLRDFLNADEALQMFERLRDELAWEQSTITIAGREHRIPRLNAWYGDPGAAYVYSGTRFEPLAWTPSLLDMKCRVEAAAGEIFNSVLANYYRDGRDSVSWHSDDEPELGDSPVIASVSLGAERRFVLKHKKRKTIPRVDIRLPAGSLLVMKGRTQHFWVHQLPKTAKPVGPRINLTFRLVRMPNKASKS